jgi:hypothetical protein
MMNLNLIIDLEYFQFGPSVLEIYILVPELLKKLQFGPWFVLDRIEDGLWVQFQYGYVSTVWSSNFDKITFWSLFWKIVALVPKFRRLNLVFFYALKSFICVVLGYVFSIFSIFVVSFPNDPQ